MLRLVAELRPRWVLAENVPGLRARGLDQVLGGLAAVGYDAEWHCIPAARVGAPHRRDRLWIVAYPAGAGLAGAGHAGTPPAPRLAGLGARLAGCAGWPPEPALGRVADGLPGRLDEAGAAAREATGTGAEVRHPGRGRSEPGLRARIRCLGNAVVPAIPEAIGRAILDAEAAGRQAKSHAS